MRAHEKGLELAAHIPADVPDALIGDPGRLRQIIVNLVGNAIKFTSSGKVILDVEIEGISAAVARLHFSVRDTGIGIAADKLEAVFQPFVQADSTTTRRFGGTGLGLTISARLVEAMGGQIWVESAIGKGTTFHFSVPLNIRAAHAKHEIVDTARRPLTPLRILLAEDNPVNQRVAVGMLRKWGQNPVVACSGLEVLAALEHDSFDLILMDVQMPEMDGYETTKCIRDKERQKGGHVTIAAVTAHAMKGDRERCRAAGMDDYVCKPFTADDLYAVLERAAQNESERRYATEQSSPARGAG